MWPSTPDRTWLWLLLSESTRHYETLSHPSSLQLYSLWQSVAPFPWTAWLTTSVLPLLFQRVQPCGYRSDVLRWWRMMCMPMLCLIHHRIFPPHCSPSYFLSCGCITNMQWWNFFMKMAWCPNANFSHYDNLVDDDNDDDMEIWLAQEHRDIHATKSLKEWLQVTQWILRRSFGYIETAKFRLE